MSVKVLGPDDLSALDTLVQAYPYKPYRNYRSLPRQRQDAVTRAEVQASLEQRGGFAVVSGHGDCQAAVIVRPLPWDSGFFNLPMARFTHVLRSAETPPDLVSAAITSALEACRTAGIRHVSARIDVADADTIQVLEDVGFRLMDALSTYIYHPRRDPPAPLKDLGVLRQARPDDTEQILDITRDAYRGFRGRFHLDRHLPQHRSDELYVEWARKCCSGEWADVVLVAEDRDGKVFGWSSYRQVEPVSSIGRTSIFGGGLGACRREKPGAYAGLIRAATIAVHGRGGVAECQTQIFNFPTIRVYEAVGMQFVRADYTLHAWLGG